MKKLLLSLLLTLFCLNSAFAKVSQYISANISSNGVYDFDVGLAALVPQPLSSTTTKPIRELKAGNGYGASYTVHTSPKYGPLIGVEIYYDSNNARYTDLASRKDIFKVKDSYGASVHLGINFNKTAIFAIVGKAVSKVETSHKALTNGTASPAGARDQLSNNYPGTVVGVGLVSELSKHFSIFVRYTMQKLSFEQPFTTKVASQATSQNSSVAMRIALDQIKVGIGYKF